MRERSDAQDVRSGIADLPRLTDGRRRRLVIALVAAGLGQALVAALTAVATPRLLEGPVADRAQLAAALVALAVGLGLLRLAERVVVERLAQDYVHEVRLGLVGAALAGPDGPHLGITVARTTNDLSALRSWVVLGIGPLAAGIPLLLGALSGLALLEPWLAAGVALPLALLGVALAALSRPAFARARELRRARGALASFVADTVGARATVLASGGAHRELKGVASRSRAVGERAVARAVVSGGMRGAAAAAGALAVVAVAVLGGLVAASPATVATAFILIGMVSQPLQDLGRVSEYRQQYRAAARIIGPQLALGRAEQERDGRLRRTAPRRPEGRVRPGPVHVADLTVAGSTLPELVALPGEVVRLRSDDPRRVRAVVDALTGTDVGHAWVSVAGYPVGELAPRDRRALVGCTTGETVLPRGSVERAVRYRLPGSSEPVDELLRIVGLTDHLAHLPKGSATVLRRGGEPLPPSARARVALARSAYGDPPLLVVDGLGPALGAGGEEALAAVVARSSGVVALAGEVPLPSGLDGVREWDLDVAPALLSR